MVRVKTIPKLDVGEEASLKAGTLAPVQLPAEKVFREIPVATQPKVLEISIDNYLNTAQNKIAAPSDAKQIVKIDPSAQAPKAPTFTAPEKHLEADPPKVTLLPTEMPPEQLKLLQALIFLEVKKNYPMALALFAELLDDPQVKTEATYQLALTAKALGLYSEYKYRMLQVLDDKNAEWEKRAAISLAMNSAEGDTEIVPTLDPKLQSFKIELDKADQYQVNRAKYYLEVSDLTKAFAAVDEVAIESPIYIDALFLKSLILYKGGQTQEAISLQQQVLKEVEAKRPDSEFKSIVALTLARLHFQSKQYKEAFDNYLKVDKKHPEWLQAMVEQAWSQILSEDYEGAAGNMFSLHTDFFKKAFNPESYVVRAVAYLNLCQFGDGGMVIYQFKKKYTPIVQMLQGYQSKMKTDIDFYDTVKTWAKNPDLKTVEGLPREFIFALTRHPSFMLQQKRINSIEDQVTKMDKINVDVIKTERKALAAQNDARAQLLELKKKDQSAKIKADVEFQEKRLLSAQIQHYIAKKARDSIKELRGQGLERLNSEKAHVRELAGKAIRTRFNQMMTKLSDSLDQSDVLKYELFSGAGEHLRYQMAGGEVDPKERPELKVEQEKALNWDFRGEIWEDELGHYRSSLKNVCAPEDK